MKRMPHEQVSTTRDLHGAIGGATMRLHHCLSGCTTIRDAPPSHVMGTFGTNRLYSVCRMVKVADRMRWGFAPARVRFPPYLKCKIHHVYICVCKYVHRMYIYFNVCRYVCVCMHCGHSRALYAVPSCSALFCATSKSLLPAYHYAHVHLQIYIY